MSGWKLPRPDGFTHATPEAIRDHARRIGHDLTPNRARDQSSRLDGWPGKYQASHAEKQQALTAPDHPIAVTKPMCPDCREFFRRHAIDSGHPQVVTDPDGRRLFPSRRSYHSQSGAEGLRAGAAHVFPAAHLAGQLGPEGGVGRGCGRRRRRLDPDGHESR